MRAEVLALLAALVIPACAIVGCSREEAPPSPDSPPQSGDAASASPRPTPPESGLSVEHANGRVTIRSSGASQAEVLAALADAAGFELQSTRRLDERLTLRIDDAAVSDVIPILSRREPYRLAFGFGPEGYALRRVEIGPSTVAVSAPAAIPAGGLAKAPPRRGREISMPSVALESGDPRERTEALLELEPEGESVEVLLALLAEEPDPNVRRAIVEVLEDAEDGRVVTALLTSLDDTDRGVVLAAIEALEWQDDPQAISRLEAMRNEPRVLQDPELGAAIDEALGWLRD